MAQKTLANARAVEIVATKAKQDSLKTLKQTMKSCIKKAVVDTVANPERLTEIGWAPKTPPQPAALPQAPMDLNIETRESGAVKLSWQRPVGSESIRNYIIESRSAVENSQFSNWQTVAIAYKREIILDRQPRGVQLEYRVKAANITGTGSASNTAAAVIL